MRKQGISNRTVRFGLISASPVALAVGLPALAAAAAAASSTVSSAVTWTLGASGFWGTGSNWSSGTFPPATRSR